MPCRVRRRAQSILLGGVAVVLAASASTAQQSPGDVFDLVLVGGRVIDGTGNPWFQADVGIRDGRIVAVGALADAEAVRRIDVTDRLVVPGFIDIHSHADEGLDAEGEPGSSGAVRRAAPNLVSQGVTELAQDLRGDIAHEIQRRGGADHLIVFEYPDSSVIGQSLAELASASGLSPVEMAIRLQLEGFSDRPGGARIRGFSLSEIDVEAFAAQPWVATASDAGIALPDDGPVHARYYGTFPRKIRRYVLERGALRLEDAIRSATSLPAQILGMKDRGLVREGFQADLAVLDLATLQDRATFFEPHQRAAGVDFVLVNGELVVDRGELTYSLPGWILTPEGNTRARSVQEGEGR